MELGIAGKVALVCGASGGIGFAAAEEFAREGCTLVICSRSERALSNAKQKLEAHGASVTAIVADLSTEAGIAAVVAGTMAAHGRVDILVANTGGPPTGAATAHSWETWTRASELLLRSVVELTRAFVPGMRERKWGRVIAITSLAVKRPQGALVLSNSLRAAVTGYLRTLADEVAPDGVTVNTVLPGFTATERLDALAEATSTRTGQSRESVFAGWTAETPVGRLGRPDELGAVIAFLCSLRAGFMTGQAVLVDGGAVRALL
ncbi:MAG: SDR family oxidoreductase [Gemmatimonadota bacterium]|jgi:3-oxoacyl-[acyl-carrier protein] reductase|nr:SDR family oxidoreductase [Gemmatimonadota bacterium]MDQ8161551.1 SDR family oxidoreductase [Gemmatimonadota bacterium]MDQ8167745.1 SDR family oxidoreductase [Gemmatimonadota bacterium]MDQ8173610.1 SDR family oxidoreductase [Gemmatimonadota bacterium]